MLFNTLKVLLLLHVCAYVLLQCFQRKIIDLLKNFFSVIKCLKKNRFVLSSNLLLICEILPWLIFFLASKEFNIVGDKLKSFGGFSGSLLLSDYFRMATLHTSCLLPSFSFELLEPCQLFLTKVIENKTGT